MVNFATLERHLIGYHHSDESLKIIAKAGEFVTRVGIYPPLLDAIKFSSFRWMELEEKGYADKKSEYRKLQ